MTKKKINVIDKNNKPISKNIQKEVIQIDQRFVNLQKKNTDTGKLLSRNGRLYKKLDNQCGMWADTGKVFKLWKKR